MDAGQTVHRLVRDGFILVYNQDGLDVVETAEALAGAGIGNLEITCRIRKPLEQIRRLRRAMPGFCIGAASLVDAPPVLRRYNARFPSDPLPTLDEAVDAGADYLVSALGFRGDAYRKYAGRIAMVPGCGTVTEIVGQYARGANLCKLFPAREIGGPAYVRAIDPAIHRLISIVPTGGTGEDNIPDYVRAGVLVLGGSFSMIPGEALGAILGGGDYGLLSREIGRVKALIDGCRSRQYPGVDFSTDSLQRICEATGRCFNLDL